MSTKQPAVTAVQQKILDRLKGSDTLSIGLVGGYRWHRPDGKSYKERCVNVDTLCSMRRKGLIRFEKRSKLIGTITIEITAVVPLLE